MPESRISVALGEVRAAMELVDNALARVNELLEEDPKFPLLVQADLSMAEGELIESKGNLRIARDSLAYADRVENKGVA